MNRVLRRTAWIAALILVPGLGTLLSGCGGNGQLSVSIAYAQGGSGPFTPGQDAQLMVTVQNNGPQDAPGVSIAVNMPTTFHYVDTNDIEADDGDGTTARTQALNARVGSENPEWGYWDIGAPDAANGPQHEYAKVQITFTVQMLAVPNSYQVTPQAQGDNTGGVVPGKSLLATVVPAPSLTATARVTPASATATATVTYTVTVSNTGTGNADSVSVLVTLPPVVAYQSVMPFAGNASENNVMTPNPDSLEAFFSGFTIPAAGGGGPGYLSISFKAQVVANPVGGSYPITVAVTDAGGDSLEVGGLAALQIKGASSTPVPAITPGPSD